MARTLSGRVQAASGALPGNKGDVLSEDYLVECKRTDKASLSIKKEWLEKIDQEAAAVNKEFVVHIEIQDRAYVLIDEDEFISLLQAVHSVDTEDC